MQLLFHVINLFSRVTIVSKRGSHDVNMKALWLLVIFINESHEKYVMGYISNF